MFAWDYCIYKIFAPLKIYFSVAMVNDLDSIIYAALINLAIAINWISPWAHKIEGLVASNTDKIKYEKLFGHFMVKADNWPNSLNGVVGERLVTYSSTRSSRKEVRGEGPFTQLIIERVIGVVVTAGKSCRSFTHIKNGLD